MTEKPFTFTEDEFNVLMMFSPYSDGVEVDLQRFKPKYLEIFHDLKTKGYFLKKTDVGNTSHVQLTAKGFELTEAPINREVFPHLTDL